MDCRMKIQGKIFKICNNIKRQNQKLSSSITERQRAKYLRYNVKVYHHLRHNRIFRRSYRKKHKKERKLLHQKKIHEDFLLHAIWLRNNPLLPNIKIIIKKQLPVTHSKKNILKSFPSNTISVTYTRGKNLRELISPSLFPGVHNQHSSSSEKFHKRCDICTKFCCFNRICLLWNQV